jgi:hypothetical protein
MFDTSVIPKGPIPAVSDILAAFRSLWTYSQVPRRLYPQFYPIGKPKYAHLCAGSQRYLRSRSHTQSFYGCTKVSLLNY